MTPFTQNKMGINSVLTTYHCSYHRNQTLITPLNIYGNLKIGFGTYLLYYYIIVHLIKKNDN